MSQGGNTGPSGPRPGDRLGRYVLLDRIGAGGMAEVYLARQEGPEGFARRVAIKFVRPDDDAPENLRSLIDEARVAAQLRHPNIVQVIELGSFDDGFYLVMEFLQGWPLDSLLKLARTNDRPADLEAVVDLGLQLLDALGYAHNARDDDTGAPMRIVHRDIKPSNVILDGLGLAKVVDFGIARSESIERRTATGVGKGTPAYMAPEQLRGEEVGAAADIFAVGVVLDEVATGRRLFTADNFLALITRRGDGYTDEDAAKLAEHLPQLVPIVKRALTMNPDTRWSDASAMADALRGVAAPTPRSAVRAWMSRILGDDPAEVLAATPTNAGTGHNEPAATVQPTAEAAVDWVEGPSSLAPTRPLVSRPGALPPAAGATVDESDATTRRWKRPGPVPILAILGIWAVLGWGVWMLWPEDLPGRGNQDPPTAEPSPDPDAVESETPPLTVDPTPGAPTPESTPAVATPTPTRAPTPEPTPEEVTPDPTPEATLETDSESDSAATASGALVVALIGSGGTVEVVGHERRAAPTGEMRLPPGVHRIKLFDRHQGLLKTAQVEIRSGEVSRCVWRSSDGVLTAVPDPEGAPCRQR